MTRILLNTPALRLANGIVAALLRRGVAMGGNILLTVPGRKSGAPRTTPVTILEWQGARYLQSTYGQVDWVHNLRAAGRATLTHGRQVESIAVVELTPAEAARVFKGTLASFPSIILSNYNVTPDSSLEAFERDAVHHPMFRVVGAISPATI